MKLFLKYLWLLLLLLLVVYGGSSYRKEWRRKIIHEKGETVEVKIDQLNCAEGTMTFHFKSLAFQKQIDARTCIIFNVGQKIKLKHNEQYPETFLFVNERSPGQFILGGLEIALGIIGLLANWPLINFGRSRKKIQTTTETPFL